MVNKPMSKTASFTPACTFPCRVQCVTTGWSCTACLSVDYVRWPENRRWGDIERDPYQISTAKRGRQWNFVKFCGPITLFCISTSIAICFEYIRQIKIDTKRKTIKYITDCTTIVKKDCTGDLFHVL